MNDKIMILDGNSLLFRAFYAMPPLKTKKGQYTNAVYGFLSMLYKLLDTYSPEYVCVAFDPKKPTFRHEQYKDYKATRAKAPDELVEQFQLIRDVLDTHKIKCVEIDGFEADDVAGTFASAAEEQGAKVYLVTSDKDYLQLIDENINVILTKKGVTNTEEMDVQAIWDTYGISPAQFVDLKALMGDSSDNIPGVGGVGEKTALKLIQEYGSLDSVYENIDNVKGKLKEKLETDKMQAYMSQTLARIIRDIPVEFNIGDYRTQKPDSKKLLALYDELEFRTFKKRMAEDNAESEEQMSIFDKQITVSDEPVLKSNDSKYIGKEEDINYVVKSILSCKKFGVKVLFDSDRVLFAQPVAFGISVDNSIYYIDLEKIEEQKALESLKPIFEGKDIQVAGHSIKNEVIYLMKKNIELNNISFDSEIGKYLLEPSESSYSVDKIAYEYLNLEIPSENDILGKGKKRLSFRELNLEKREKYIYNYLSTVVKAEKQITDEIEELGMTELFKIIELPLIEVLAYMEFVGFKVDMNVIDSVGVHLHSYRP